MSKDKKKVVQKKPMNNTKVNMTINKPQISLKFMAPNSSKFFSKISKFFTKIFAKIKTWNWKVILKIVSLVLIVVGSFALIDLGVQFFNNDYSVAVVDGSRISKSKWNKLLQQAYGSAAATQLIENEVIYQEAKKANITASKEEIQSQVDQIITSLGGQTEYEAALKANNLTDAALKEEIKLDILTNKLISPSIKYTDDDLKSFFNQYSAQMFPTETAALASGAKLDFDTYKDRTITFYKQQQVSNTKATWLTTKEASYTIQNNSTSKPSYGLFGTTINIIKNLTAAKK